MADLHKGDNLRICYKHQTDLCCIDRSTEVNTPILICSGLNLCQGTHYSALIIFFDRFLNFEIISLMVVVEPLYCCNSKYI